jgi:hypothetical protein
MGPADNAPPTVQPALVSHERRGISARKCCYGGSSLGVDAYQILRPQVWALGRE